MSRPIAIRHRRLADEPEEPEPEEQRQPERETDDRDRRAIAAIGTQIARTRPHPAVANGAVRIASAVRSAPRGASSISSSPTSRIEIAMAALTSRRRAPPPVRTG